eukprot:CAMPEP_0195056740 /NCGR_PEP_ID=MMETSP0448-20130528/5006_1 /TAXON_ID=66468 /ORGANISM="Heterocapsa triquestra, Strain CCMP 448" /LENGTH=919 /DNA_ID=CAMNT_0040086583 /DNA_START=56 /DNA_END=2815 /DNA_ORIENTATION=-
MAPPACAAISPQDLREAGYPTRIVDITVQPTSQNKKTRMMSTPVHVERTSDGQVAAAGDLLSVTKHISVRSSSSGRSTTQGAKGKKKTTRRPENPTMIALRRFVVPILESQAFTVVFGCCLFFALFGAPLFTIFSVPDEPGVAVLDGGMIVVLACFLIDLICRCIAYTQSYFLTLFFWLDCIGTASVILDISFLLGNGGKVMTMEQHPNATLLRFTRAAKVGARAGRFTKIMKMISMMYAEREQPGKKKGGGTAVVLTKRLTRALSTKVSIVTVALVLTTPLFAISLYPEEDMSLRMGTNELEAQYQEAVEYLEMNSSADTTDKFHRAVTRFMNFYENNSYYPFRMEGFPESITVNGRAVTIPGERLIMEEDPGRKQDIAVQLVRGCLIEREGCSGDLWANVQYNFQVPNDLEAWMDIAVLCFAVLVLMLESFDITHSIDGMLVKPMERMLDSIRAASQTILDQIQSAHADAMDLEELDEAELLELLVPKLSQLSGMFVQKGMVSSKELHQLDDGSKGVLVELMALGTDGVGSIPKEHVQRPVLEEGKVSVAYATSDMPVSEETLASWDWDPLSLEVDQMPRIVFHIFFDSLIGSSTGRNFADPNTFHRFQDAVRAGYTFDNPYHNYAHGVDVTNNTFRMISDLGAMEWLSEVDVFALLVSALGHDLGHVGKTNPFLMETQSELALLYNDKSPLENMHCARLFEICQKHETNIFEQLGKKSFKQARAVCIHTILSTDNANHFDMVKSVNKVYTLHTELCDRVARGDPNEPKPRAYLEDVLQAENMLWLSTILHMCDIANPIKGFQANKRWANLVCDEFFLQGDVEKSLGMPVGMLNDRDKVSREGGQHGFIVFLVAPLVVGAVGVFPDMQARADQLAENLEEWRVSWVKAASPPEEDVQKRVADVKKVREQVQQLRDRA